MEEYVYRQGRQYLYAKDYQEQEVLRTRMGTLCRHIWGFDFEKMYQNGSWSVDFHPYTLFDGERAASHISALEMDFCLNGEVLHLVQIGTVMTDEEYREQGLSRYLLERILDDFANCDAVFLYANETVLDFYPKFGFEAANEYPRNVTGKFLAQLKKEAGTVLTAVKFDALGTGEAEDFLLTRSENCKNGCRFYPVNNRFMVQFYLKLMDAFSIADMLYLLPDGKTVVLAEVSEDSVIIHDIFTDCGCRLEDVFTALITQQTKRAEVRLAYEEPFLEMTEEAGADDLWLYVWGKHARQLKKNHIMFPMAAHT